MNQPAIALTDEQANRLLPLHVHATTVSAREALLTDYAAWRRDLLVGIRKGPEAYQLAEPRVISFMDPPDATPRVRAPDISHWLDLKAPRSGFINNKPR